MDDRFTIVHSNPIWYLSIYLDGDKLQSITTHATEEQAFLAANFDDLTLKGGVNKLGDHEYTGKWWGREARDD